MAEPQTRLVSWFERAKGKPFAAADRKMMELLERIPVSETLAGLIEELRYLDPQSDEAREFKSTKLPAITPSAAFGKTRRAEASAWKHTGAIVLDYDHVDDVEDARRAAGELLAPEGRRSSTIAAFRSPSGDGLKVLVHVSPLPRSLDDHAAAFERVRGYYDGELGLDSDAGGDVTRLCFLTHDPEAILRPAGETWALVWR